MNEFAICWVKGDERASVTAPSGSWLKGRLMKLKEQYPEEVSVHENNDGSVCASVPVSYVKVSHPKKLTEEQKKAAGERMKALQDRRKAVESMWDDSEGWEEEDD